MKRGVTWNVTVSYQDGAAVGFKLSDLRGLFLVQPDLDLDGAESITITKDRQEAAET